MRTKITVFINPSCGPCIKLKSWLRERSIPFIEKDIMNDSKARGEFDKLGQRYTPLTIIETKEGQQTIIGANTTKFELLLDLKPQE